MKPEELKALKDALEKNITDGIALLKTQAGEAATKAQADVDALKLQLKDVTDKLSAIESMPALKTAKRVRAADVGEKYLGIRIASQGKALRNKCVDKAGFENFNSEETCDNFTKFMIAFIKGVGPERNAEALAEISKINAACKATMNEGTNSIGGYLVPIEYQWDLVRLNKDKVFSLNECTVVPMSSDTKQLPKELTRAGVAWKGESVQLAQSDPTYSDVVLNAQKLTAYTASSNELLMDSAMDIVSIISDQMSYGMALELDNQVLNGTGSPVSGVLTAAAGFSVVMGTGSTSFSAISFDNLSNMFDNIPEGWDDNVKFIFNKKIMGYLRTIKSTYNTYILVDPGGTQTPTIWEQPVIRSSQGPKTSGLSTAFMVLGNFQYFYIGQRMGAMAIDVDPYGRFDYNETRFRMITRWGLQIAQANAFVRLLTSAS